MIESIFDINNLSFRTVKEVFGIQLYHGDRLTQISDYAINQIKEKSIELLPIALEDKDANIIAVFETGEAAMAFKCDNGLSDKPIWLNGDWSLSENLY